MRVKGRDCAFIVTDGTNDTHRFPLSWTNDLQILIGFDFDFLISVKKEVVQVLNDSEVRSSRSKFTLDQEEDSRIVEYFSDFTAKEIFSLRLFIRYNTYVFLVGKSLKFL